MVDAVEKRRGSATRFGGWGVVGLVACGGIGVWFLGSREPSRAPPTGYVHPIPETDAEIDGIDLETLHRQRIPAFVLARGEARDADRRALMDAVARDRVLTSAMAQLVDAVEAHELAAARHAADTVNVAQRARGMPWRVQVGGARSGVYVKTYWVVARPSVRVGDRSIDVALSVRSDPLNVVEGWLGVAEDAGGASVVVDRVRDFATDIVWPLLGDEDHPHRAAVLALARERLGPRTLDVLQRTAPARQGMLAARDAIYGRRASCGSQFGMYLRWDGVDDLAGLRSWARREAASPCPGITRDEAAAIVRGTLALRDEVGLPAALEALVAWSARHVAYHEARHGLDAEDWGFGTGPPCTGCPSLDQRAVGELSAYLTSWGTDEAPLAWVQACSVLESGAGGPGPRALEALQAELGESCEGPPPSDLATRARRLERTWFHRSEEAALPASFPGRLPLEITGSATAG